MLRYCLLTQMIKKEISTVYRNKTLTDSHDIDRSIESSIDTSSITIDAGNIAKKAEVRNLLIGHFSQRYRDDRELLIETQKTSEETNYVVHEKQF